MSSLVTVLPRTPPHSGIRRPYVEFLPLFSEMKAEYEVQRFKNDNTRIGLEEEGLKMDQARIASERQRLETQSELDQRRLKMDEVKSKLNTLKFLKENGVLSEDFKQRSLEIAGIL